MSNYVFAINFGKNNKIVSYNQYIPRFIITDEDKKNNSINISMYNVIKVCNIAFAYGKKVLIPISMFDDKFTISPCHDNYDIYGIDGKIIKYISRFRMLLIDTTQHLLMNLME